MMNMRLMGEVKTIALATDGSVYTDGAVQEMIFLAQGCGAKIVVLNVVAIESESTTSFQASSKEVNPELTDYLDKIKKMADDSGIECEIVIEKSFYRPDRTIVDLAYKHKADLLIMGRHGKRGLRKLLVGSMTSNVIGQGFPQVLVVPKDFTIGGETILVATDGSEAAQMAAETAINMGKNCSNIKDVHILSVASSEAELDQAKELTSRLCREGQEQVPEIAYHPLVMVGKNTANLITSAAEKNNVDIILIGGFGKGLSKLLMGHVTEKVIGRSHCAVLVVEKNKS